MDALVLRMLQIEVCSRSGSHGGVVIFEVRKREVCIRKWVTAGPGLRVKPIACVI